VEAIIKQLAGKVGEVVGLEMRAIATAKGEFYRARVKLDASQPLTRCFTLSPEGCASMLLLVKYEKMPHFYSFCGMMGHTHLECGTREHPEEDLQFGAWMVADEELWHPSTPRVRIFNTKRGAMGGSSNECGGKVPRGGRSRRGTE
jgi:hypothetical protein